MGRHGRYSMIEKTLKTGEGFPDLGKFVYQVIQQISIESACHARFWEIQGKVNNTVLYSEQSLSALDTNYGTIFDIAWTVKVMSILKVLHMAL